MDKIEQIKKQVQAECIASRKAPTWFFDRHLLAVEKCAKLLLEKMPEANPEIVLLSVWLHEMERIRDVHGDHSALGAAEAEKILAENNYPSETITAVKEVILTHRCKDDNQPQTIEGKVFASADAKSHYYSGFYLAMATVGRRGVGEYRDWARHKLQRDYDDKIFFDFAKDMIKERHEIVKKFIDLD